MKQAHHCSKKFFEVLEVQKKWNEIIIKNIVKFYGTFSNSLYLQERWNVRLESPFPNYYVFLFFCSQICNIAVQVVSPFGTAAPKNLQFSVYFVLIYYFRGTPDPSFESPILVNRNKILNKIVSRPWIKLQAVKEGWSNKKNKKLG